MSIFDDYESVLDFFYGDQERQRSIQNIQRRSEAMERELEEQPAIERMIAPGATMLRGLDMTIGRPTRERMIKALELGGTPVRDERGMTVGVVRRGAGVFGGDDYVGRPDYNPIAARVNRMTGTGDQFPMFEERGGVIRARALTPTERSMLPGEDGTAATIMGAAPPAPPPATTGVTGTPEVDAAAAAARAEEQVRMQRSRRRGRTATIVGGLLDDAPATGQAPTLLG